MKTIIKTTLFATLTVAIAFNSKRITEECSQTYNNCVSYLASNASVPNGF